MASMPLVLLKGIHGPARTTCMVSLGDQIVQEPGAKAEDIEQGDLELGSSCNSYEV